MLQVPSVYLALEESACSMANVVLFQFEILLSGKLKECVFCLSVTSWLPKTFFRMKNSKSNMQNLRRNVGSMKDYGKLKTNPMLKCSGVSLLRMKWVFVILAERNRNETGVHYHHHHLFLKRLFLPRSARVRRFSRYEVSPHIPEHYPFRVQTQLIHIILHTFSPKSSCPYPAHLTPATTTFLQADTQSSPLLRSTCPNHLNLPRLTTSATLWTLKKLYKSTLRFLSFSDTPHIHLTSGCCRMYIISHVHRTVITRVPSGFSGYK